MDRQLLALRILTPTLYLTIFILLFVAGCEQNSPSYLCKDPIGCVDIPAGAPLKIGNLQALSGKVANLGEEQIRGLTLALDERNGKVAGRDVSLQTVDTRCSAEGGANGALRIIADPQHVAIFGSTCSGAAATAAKAMSEAGLVMISGNNSAPFLTSIANKRAPNWQKGYFRTAFNEETAGIAAATYAYHELGVRKTASIHDGDIYTRGLTDGFNKAFLSLGGQVVLDTSINKGDTNMGPVLTAVLNAQAELLFFPLFQPEGNSILYKARSIAKFSDIILMSDGALINNAFLEDVGETALGMYFVGPASPKGPLVDTLVKKYIQKFNSQPPTFYFTSAYDAANLLFRAIESVAQKDHEGTLHIGRNDLRDALYDMKKIPGVTGELSCDEFGDCAFPLFNVLQYENPTEKLDGLKSNIKYTYSLEE